MTKKTGERVGGAFGHVEEVDVPENEVGWWPYLQVHISVDITKPIPRGRLVTFRSLGQIRSNSSSSGEMKQYCSWLRAAELGPRWKDVSGGQCMKQHPLSVHACGARSGTNSKFENNRQANISEFSSSRVREKPQKNKEPTLPAYLEVSQIGGHAKYEVHGFTDVGSTSSHTPTKSPRGGEMGNVGPASSTAALTKGKDKGQKSWKRLELRRGKEVVLRWRWRVLNDGNLFVVFHEASVTKWLKVSDGNGDSTFSLSTKAATQPDGTNKVAMLEL
ncbi:hypothetical protein FCV25MIE_29212 [Fagus crenata]